LLARLRRDGHEIVDGVGLIHMNGRVYDPEIGRFLSADPFVQDLGSLQSLNRYSYVLNNPLSYTDPSGYFFAKLFKSIGKALSGLFRAVGNVLKAVLKNPIVRAIIQIAGCAAATAVGMPIGCAALSGALTLASGGSVADPQDDDTRLEPCRRPVHTDHEHQIGLRGGDQLWRKLPQPEQTKPSGQRISIGACRHRSSVPQHIERGEVAPLLKLQRVPRDTICPLEITDNIMSTT
jgi:RHS repeat-associated protein